jgi:hypothetical protein
MIQHENASRSADFRRAWDLRQPGDDPFLQYLARAFCMTRFCAARGQGLADGSFRSGKLGKLTVPTRENALDALEKRRVGIERVEEI